MASHQSGIARFFSHKRPADTTPVTPASQVMAASVASSSTLAATPAISPPIQRPAKKKLSEIILSSPKRFMNVVLSFVGSDKKKTSSVAISIENLAKLGPEAMDTCHSAGIKKKGEYH